MQGNTHEREHGNFTETFTARRRSVFQPEKAPRLGLPGRNYCTQLSVKTQNMHLRQMPGLFQAPEEVSQQNRATRDLCPGPRKCLMNRSWNNLANCAKASPAVAVTNAKLKTMFVAA